MEVVSVRDANGTGRRNLSCKVWGRVMKAEGAWSLVTEEPTGRGCGVTGHEESGCDAGTHVKACRARGYRRQWTALGRDSCQGAVGKPHSPPLPSYEQCPLASLNLAVLVGPPCQAHGRYFINV